MGKQRPSEYRGHPVHTELGRKPCTAHGCDGEMTLKLTQHWKPKIIAGCPACGKKEYYSQAETDAFLDQKHAADQPTNEPQKELEGADDGWNW